MKADGRPETAHTLLLSGSIASPWLSIYDTPDVDSFGVRHTTYLSPCCHTSESSTGKGIENHSNNSIESHYLRCPGAARHRHYLDCPINKISSGGIDRWRPHCRVWYCKAFDEQLYIRITTRSGFASRPKRNQGDRSRWSPPWRFSHIRCLAKSRAVSKRGPIRLMSWQVRPAHREIFAR